MAAVVQRSARSPAPRGQRGAVAVVVALSALVLFGFAGIAIDVGRLFINRTELQTAADACALAAAAELTCDATTGTCPGSFLLNAQAAGIYAAGLNRRDFQVNPVAIAAADVKFYTALAPNANYLSIAGGAAPNSRYVMCTASAGGIAPWFMGVFGTGAQTVTSAGVATRAPAQSFCNAAPLGICKKAVGTYAVGEWIKSSFKANDDFDDTKINNFKWVEFTNASDIKAQLAGSQTVCGIRIGDTINTPGNKTGVKLAYNTRFGLYKGEFKDAADAPPDHTGYAYPNAAPGSPVISIPAAAPFLGNAYSDYRIRQGQSKPFVSNEYDSAAAGGKESGSVVTPSPYQTLGSDRRLVTVPIIDCAGGKLVPILSMACVLMLNPMANGKGDFYLEYRGDATALGSPCRVGGLAGGATSTGPQAPVLVQ